MSVELVRDRLAGLPARLLPSLPAPSKLLVELFRDDGVSTMIGLKSLMLPFEPLLSIDTFAAGELSSLLIGKLGSSECEADRLNRGCEAGGAAFVCSVVLVVWLIRDLD